MSITRLDSRDVDYGERVFFLLWQHGIHYAVNVLLNRAKYKTFNSNLSNKHAWHRWSFTLKTTVLYNLSNKPFVPFSVDTVVGRWQYSYMKESLSLLSRWKVIDSPKSISFFYSRASVCTANIMPIQPLSICNLYYWSQTNGQWDNGIVWMLTKSLIQCSHKNTDTTLVRALLSLCPLSLLELIGCGSFSSTSISFSFQMAAQCQACQKIESSHPDSCCFSLSQLYEADLWRYYTSIYSMSKLKQDTQGCNICFFDILTNTLPFSI